MHCLCMWQALQLNCHSTQNLSVHAVPALYLACEISLCILQQKKTSFLLHWLDLLRDAMNLNLLSVDSTSARKASLYVCASQEGRDREGVNVRCCEIDRLQVKGHK